MKTIGKFDMHSYSISHSQKPGMRRGVILGRNHYPVSFSDAYGGKHIETDKMMTAVGFGALFASGLAMIAGIIGLLSIVAAIALSLAMLFGVDTGLAMIDIVRMLVAGSFGAVFGGILSPFMMGGKFMDKMVDAEYFDYDLIIPKEKILVGRNKTIANLFARISDLEEPSQELIHSYNKFTELYEKARQNYRTRGFETDKALDIAIEENLNKLDKMIQDETEFEYQMKIQTAQAEREMYELAYESSPQKQEDEDFAKLIREEYIQPKLS